MSEGLWQQQRFRSASRSIVCYTTWRWVRGEGFVFDMPLGPDNVNVMTDSNPWTDQIRPRLTVFGDIGKKGNLSAAAFLII